MVKYGHVGFCLGKGEDYYFFLKLLQPQVSKLLKVFNYIINESMKLNDIRGQCHSFNFAKTIAAFDLKVGT